MPCFAHHHDNSLADAPGADVRNGDPARRLMRALRLGVLVGVLGFAIIASPLHLASARDGKDSDHDCKGNQECALNALRQGQIKPLTEVLAAARAQVPGEVIKVELDRDDGVWVYEIKILTPNGRRREVEIDAQTLTILKID